MKINLEAKRRGPNSTFFSISFLRPRPSGFLEPFDDLVGNANYRFDQLLVDIKIALVLCDIAFPNVPDRVRATARMEDRQCTGDIETRGSDSRIGILTIDQFASAAIAHLFPSRPLVAGAKADFQTPGRVESGTEK